MYLPDLTSESSPYSVKAYPITTRNQLMTHLKDRGYDTISLVSACPPALLFSSELRGKGEYSPDLVPLNDDAQLAVVLDNPSMALPMPVTVQSIRKDLDSATKLVSNK